MKDALNNTSDICRVKRNCPLSSLAIWKQNNRVKLRKEGLFVEPFISGKQCFSCSCCLNIALVAFPLNQVYSSAGISTDLQGIYKEDSIKHHLVSTEAPQQETDIAQSPLPGHGYDIETEIQRNECASPVVFIPGPTSVVPSHSGRSYLTPINSNDKSEHLEIPEDEISPTVGGVSVNPDSEIRTPNTFYEKDVQDEPAFSDIPEMVASPGVCSLCLLMIFLEV